MQAQEYDNQLLQKEHNEKYDSAIEQVKRERAAGLNPDLTGNVDAGSSAAPVDDGNPPISPEADDLAIVQNFASAAIQGVELAFGLAKDIQGLKAMRLENLTKEDNFTMSALLNVMDDVWSNRNESDGTISVDNYYRRFKEAYGNSMSKRQFERFVRRANMFQNGLAFSDKEFGTRQSRANNRKGFFRATSGSLDYSELDDVMQVVSGELSDLATSVFKSEAKEQKIEADKMSEYWKSRDTSAQAQAHNLQDEASARTSQNAADMSDYQKLLRKSFERIMNKLDKRSEQGNHFASIAQALMSAVLLNVISIPSPSASYQSGPKGSKTSISF